MIHETFGCGLMVSVLGCKRLMCVYSEVGIWHHSVAHSASREKNALRHLWRCRRAARAPTNENELTAAVRKREYSRRALLETRKSATL